MAHLSLWVALSTGYLGRMLPMQTCSLFSEVLLSLVWVSSQVYRFPKISAVSMIQLVAGTCTWEHSVVEHSRELQPRKSMNSATAGQIIVLGSWTSG